MTGSADARQAIVDGVHPEEIVAQIAPAPHDWGEVVAAAEERLEQASA